MMMQKKWNILLMDGCEMNNILDKLLEDMRLGGNKSIIYNEQTEIWEDKIDYEMDGGIYLLFNGPELVYIGKGSIKKRVNDHKKEGWNFDSVYYIRNAWIIHVIENLLITNIQPKYNKGVCIIE